MLKIKVKYFLSREGLNYFPTWYDEVLNMTATQDGYENMFLEMHGSNPVVFLYFENLQKLEKWASTQIHNDFVANIEKYFISPQEVELDEVHEESV